MGRPVGVGTSTLPAADRCVPRPRVRWTGRCRWMPRSRGPISTLPARPGPEKGAPSNYKNSWPEPNDHALGRSRGGWTTKTHAAVDGNGRLLSVVVTAGQAGDNPHLPAVIDAIRVPTAGRPRSRPDTVIADKAYSHPCTRVLLRQRQIKAVIPQRSDQIAHRKTRARPAGDPRGSTRKSIDCATSWNELSTGSNNGAVSLPDTTRPPGTTAPGSCWPRASCSGYNQLTDTP